MVWRSGDPRRDGEALSAALKGVRRRRDLLARDVAAAMNMPLRTYEHFESGQGRINLDHIHRFARATNCDPLSILVSVRIGSPDFARRTVDNKLMLVFLIALEEFESEMGERLSQVDIRDLIAAFTTAFETLSEDARRQRDDVNAWAQRAQSIR